jgi:diaminohydroxyphosphoribosylaminopyrimidine deaminase/5-amino-6-(5-phosphoribosylamino)uracil reductase
MTREESLLSLALECASKAWGQTSPNPMVGAVLARGDVVLAQAWHRRAGEAHAEPQVLQKLLDGSLSDDKSGSSDDDLTLYVNLEPCNHVGRTPPCTEAILASGIRRVVVSLPDPDRRVAGQGIARLRQAGLQVEVGVLADQARELNHVFWGRQLRQRPFIALKVALSGDGCIATAAGQPAAISSKRALQHSHQVRAGLDGILVGIETMQRDRPRLDSRLVGEQAANPRRLLIDPGLRLQRDWLQPGADKPIVLCSSTALLALGATARRDWENLVEFQVLPGKRQHLQLEHLPDVLQAHGLWSVLVEGGGETHRRFLEAGLWDRMYLYRHESLPLRGTAWSAADAWQHQQRHTLQLQQLEWDGTRCTIYAHRDAWNQA